MRTVRVLFLLFTVLGASLAHAAADVRINVGGPAFTDTAGHLWEADRGFTGGTAAVTTLPIANTANDALYQSQRYGVSSYAIAVPNGSYIVLLHWAEHYEANFGVGRRIFRTEIEGSLSGDYDIFAAVGANTAFITNSTVTITDGTLNIRLIERTQSPTLAAIEILDPAIAPPPGYPSNVGGNCSRAYWDTNLRGGVIRWYCPPAVAGQPWTREGFYGNWSEVAGGAAEVMRLAHGLVNGSTSATLAMMWSNLVRRDPSQDYSGITAMVVALDATYDAVNLPAPPPPMTIADQVYTMQKQASRMVPIVVGRVAGPTPCNAQQTVNGLMAIAVSAVIWTGSVRTTAPYSLCAPKSP